MSSTVKRINAITGLKFQTIISNLSMMSNPLIALFLVIVFRKVMANLPQGSGAFRVDAFLLGLGLIMNIVSGGLLISSTSIAEEKEKNTLRVLMTSSVKSNEYLIGSLIPTFSIIMIVNLLLIPASGISYSAIHLPTFLLITASGTLISIIIGFVIGILTKDQMQSGVICTPILLVFTMLPQLRFFSSTIEKVSSYTYSGVIASYVDGIFSKEGYALNSRDLVTVAIWFILGIVIFILAYKKRGMESD
ncbi:ABC-2 type transport system permease protein [Enterococcus malodoratus]|uniref:ABC transporter permease n=1 Tax=Enterococcus malodoratus TaxID=71451 RepID=UPI0008B033B4|nr:ABC transporter permease [Enterococcus malodoratus]SES62417.1 ABC-2 type transport system permease protein [Enterococcus malodoratus]